jgi:hypothetical protein
MADACEVTGYNRDQLRGVLDKLPEFSERTVLPRSAREFTSQDLIVLSVLVELERQIGVERDTAVSIEPLLRKALSGPKNVDSNARIFMSFNPAFAQYLTNGPLPQYDGVIVLLGPIFNRIDHYLIPGGTARQADLTLGPTLMKKGVV